MLPARPGGWTCRYHTILHLTNHLRLLLLDLHIGNLAFTIPSIHALREEELFQKLGMPDTGPVQRSDRRPLESGMPRYLVRPTSFPTDIRSSLKSIKIIDFGQSFSRHDTPSEFHIPLPVRAPEIIFKDKVDYRMDLWSMGCMVSPRSEAQRYNSY